VAGIFRDYGYRRLRSRARLKFLVADWGVEKFRSILEDEYLDRRLVDCPSPASPRVAGDHVGVHRQKDGEFYVGAAPTVGRVSGTLLSRLGDLVEEYGAQGVRLTAYQKLVVLGVAEDKVDAFVAALDGIGLSARPSNWRKNTMACTGIEFCKLAIVDTKNRAAALVDEARAPVPDLDADHRERQRLPQLVCPHPGRRRRPQGHGAEGRRRQPRGGLPGPPRRRARPRPGLRQEAPGAQVTSAGLDDYVTAVARLPGRPRGRRDVPGLGAPRRRRAAARRDRRPHPGGSPMSARAVPFHCPYCGDENLRPHEDTHGAWECRACLRAFSLKMLGLIAPRPVPGEARS
jgi:sulfite reductase (ferredoxin)